MPKRYQKRQRKPPLSSRQAQSAVIPPALQARLDEAADLLEHGEVGKVVHLLEPLTAKYPRVARLHETLGVAYVGLGNLWGALAALRRAFELNPAEVHWEPLARLYLQMELRSHALHAFRQFLPWAATDAAGGTAHSHLTVSEILEIIDFLERVVREMADSLGISPARAERGLHELEEGTIALHQGDYSACIKANRRAIKLLGDWPPPHNNLSLALFFSGSPKQAIATARQVVERDPYNVQALGNLCRFLAWTGDAKQARAIWAQMKTLEPADASSRLKMAEAAAIVEDDQAVYNLLRQWAGPVADEESTPAYFPHTQFLLGVAEANLGKPEARHRLARAEGRMANMSPVLKALDAGLPGPGLATRYPYFSVSEMLPAPSMLELSEIMRSKDSLPNKQFRRQMDNYLARFPQTVLVAEKLLLEGEQPDAAIMLLDAIGTPEAYDVLRRFGLGQAGEISHRIKALNSLAEAGLIAHSDTLRVWVRGEWRDIQLRKYEISETGPPERAPQVADLMFRAESALAAGDDKEAERLFWSALERDPRVKEACNNLGAIYSRRGDHSRAKEMFRAALEIDPDYLLPICNLVVYLLDDDDLDAAEAMLRPLADRTHFRPNELAFYSFLQARLAVAKEEYDAARDALEMALEVVPDYEAAQDLLRRLELYLAAPEAFAVFRERERRRDEAHRRRLQSRLSTRAPRLGDALSLYTRDALTSMGRVVWPYTSWSGLRKADLVSELAQTLQQPATLDRIVDGLAEDERQAVRRVVAQDGHMPWADFDAQFGNDLAESRYWQWHEPATTMGRLRQRGLLVEATVDGELLVAIPLELRQPLAARLGGTD